SAPRRHIGQQIVAGPPAQPHLRSEVGRADVNEVDRNPQGLATPVSDTIGSDGQDHSASGGAAGDAAAGQGATAGVLASHDDVRATRRRHTSGWLGRYVGLVIVGIAIGGALLLW